MRRADSVCVWVKGRVSARERERNPGDRRRRKTRPRKQRETDRPVRHAGRKRRKEAASPIPQRHRRPRVQREARQPHERTAFVQKGGGTTAALPALSQKPWLSTSHENSARTRWPRPRRMGGERGCCHADSIQDTDATHDGSRSQQAASSGFRIGPLLPGDLDAVMWVQEQGYAPELLEGPEVFRAILAHQPDLCRAVLADSEKRRVVGYMVAHRVRDTAAPPPLGEAPGPGSFPEEGPVFIHDVCLLEEARGRGLVTRLLGEIQEGAVHGMCLVAVQGTEAMWRRHGFAPHSPDGAAAVRGGSSPRVSTTADGASAGEGVQRHENLLATAASVSDVAGSAQGCGHEPPSGPVLQGYGPQSTYMTRKLSSVSVPR